MAIARRPQTYPALPATLLPSSSASINASPSRPEIPHNVLARVFTTHIIHTFGSARYPYPSLRSMWQVTLSVYITNILYASHLPIEVGMSAMVLLFRYKAAVPHSVAYGDDAARLFLAAYIVAAKVISDADLEPKGSGASLPQGLDFWFRISHKRFPMEELRRMERELCRTLRWDVQVSREDFTRFRRVVYQECEVGDEVLETIEEEEEMREEERLRREQHVERPPPPYCETERDVRVIEISVALDTVTDPDSYTGARRGSRQGEISSLARSQAQTLIPSAYDMSHEDVEDRLSFGRIFEETMLSPMSRRRWTGEATQRISRKVC